MFKKFTRSDIHSRTNTKSSVARSLRSKLTAQFPNLEERIEEIIPKKSQVVQLKCADKVSLYSVDNHILFIQHFDDDLVPTLRLVHTLPKDTFPHVTVDRGAIKFILGGANIMCPGLTSKGAQLPDDENGYEKGQTVVIYAEGKDHALAMGTLTMSTKDLKAINKGIGIEVVTYLGDGLWALGE